MKKASVDVIIPTFHPGKDFHVLLERLMEQSYPVRKILIMNTEEQFWNSVWEEEFPLIEVHHVRQEEFDHGGTRRRAAGLSEADIMVFMTQDAVPAGKKLIENLIRPLLEEEGVGAAYARQLPKPDCSLAERYTRSFNYPAEASVKRQEDLPVYGIKTYFCSNVCAAYRRSVYEDLGGFVERTIFNEDMIYAAKLIRHGGGVAYAADARVLHSHNYSCAQQFRRNFDLGVSQAEHPEVFLDVPSEGEGVRLVKKTLAYLLRKGRFWLIPGFVLQSACKYAGYLAGKNYRRLSPGMVRKCTMNSGYWR